MRLLTICFCASLTLACSSTHSDETAAPPPSAPYSAPQASDPSPSQRECDRETSILIGRIYYLANPAAEHLHFDTLEEFVSDNSRRLSRDTQFARCATRAGARLRSAGFASFDARTADEAYASALNNGATIEQAQSVQSSINRGSLELATMGQELSWMARVIPSAAEGDWDPYRSPPDTQARQMIRQVWPLYEGLFADPSTRATFEEAINQFQPWLEYQVAFLVAQTP